MKKFLLLYKSSVSAAHQMANATPEQMKAMDLWKSWAQQAQKAIVAIGMPLGNPKEIGGGSVRRSDSQVGGFSILQADSESAVTDLLKSHPHHSIRADKIVDGVAVTMGTSKWKCDAEHHLLTWETPRQTWSLQMTGDAISGTLTLADKRVMRRVTLKRDNDGRRPATNP